ncbi:MAG: hypothetical protein ACRC5M_01575 [Anaeroplasmataceae bacterium]
MKTNEKETVIVKDMAYEEKKRLREQKRLEREKEIAKAQKKLDKKKGKTFNPIETLWGKILIVILAGSMVIGSIAGVIFIIIESFKRV